MLYALAMIVALALLYSIFGFENAVITGLVLVLVHLKDINDKLRNR